MRRGDRNRGIALITVLLATALLLVLVAVLVDLGTLQLQKATADLRAVQALAGADAGLAWVRAVLQQQQGDVAATMAKLGTMQGKRRFPIDDSTYVVAAVMLLPAPSPAPTGDHFDANLQQYPRAIEQPVQVQSSATVYVDSTPVTRRVTVTMLRVFPAAPYSAVVGFVDDASPVGINSPGDAGGQIYGPNATELLVHAYAMSQISEPQKVDQFGDTTWSDNNTGGGPGPLP